MVEHPYQSIVLFGRCDATRWAHLPCPGGWYGQDPQLLDEWDVIFHERAEYEKRKQMERERDAHRPKSSMSGRGRARRF